MRIVVIGGGNIGCLYGANLARVGAEVALIDVWAPHVQQIRTHGLRVEGLHGAFTARVEAALPTEAVAPADLALVCVNAYSTGEAARTALAALAPDGYAVTLQNGLGNIEALSEVLGAGRVLAGLSFHSAEILEPGRVNHTNQGPTYLGEIDRARTPRLLALERLLREADMEPVLEEDIVATVWGKFVHNCAINALCAATGLRPGQIREVPAVDELQTRIIHEALALVRARGIVLPEKDPLTAIKAYCARKFHRVSMVQHLARGSRTEIDALNGYVVRESQKLGLAAPWNEALTALVKGLEHAAISARR